MFTVDQVLRLIHQLVEPVAPEPVHLRDALGQVLAAPVVLDLDAPPFDRAVLDGFAVRAADTDRLEPLLIIGHQDAGGLPFTTPVGPGQCVRINTGAPMPPTADAVLMVELSEQVPGPAVGGSTKTDAHRIRPLRAVSPGEAVQRRGHDAAAGDTVLFPATRLTPAHLAVAATAGADQLPIRRPSVAILTTGDELVDISATPAPRPAPGPIRNSNRPMLAALVAQFLTLGAVLDLGNCPDDAPELRRRILHALEKADLLVISGGMSMGTRDLAPQLLAELVFVLHVEKVRMKPGKPFLFGSLPHNGRTRYVAGLPGNPVSAFVTFHRFVREILASLCDAPAPRLLVAHSTVELPPNADREFYQPCSLSLEDAALRATPLTWKGSADLFTLARATALLIRPPDAPALSANAPVPILPLAALP